MKEYKFSNGSKIVADKMFTGETHIGGEKDGILFESKFFDVYDRHGNLIAGKLETYEEAEELAKQ